VILVITFLLVLRTRQARPLPDGYHYCPAWRCDRHVPNKFLMCGQHWAMVPGDLQTAVYSAYNRGRGLLPNGLPGPPLMHAQQAAIMAVDAALGKPPPGHTADPITGTH
jgi:hypothetical protein